MNNSIIGISGVHHVVSELSRRGMVALPTVKNTAAYDIVALNVDGTRHANIQVKTSSKKVGFFPMPGPEKVRAGPRDFYTLVRWVATDQRYEVFLLTGKQACAAVEASKHYQSRPKRDGTQRKFFPCIYVGAREAQDVQRWKDAWARWKL